MLRNDVMIVLTEFSTDYISLTAIIIGLVHTLDFIFGLTDYEFFIQFLQTIVPYHITNI